MLLHSEVLYNCLRRWYFILLSNPQSHYVSHHYLYWWNDQVLTWTTGLVNLFLSEYFAVCWETGCSESSNCWNVYSHARILCGIVNTEQCVCLIKQDSRHTKDVIIHSNEENTIQQRNMRCEIINFCVTFSILRTMYIYKSNRTHLVLSKISLMVLKFITN